MHPHYRTFLTIILSIIILKEIFYTQKVEAGASPVIGRCTLVSYSFFPHFDLEKFGDNSIGRCLLKEYFPDIGNQGYPAITSQLKTITFLNKDKKWEVHKNLVPIYKKIEKEISDLVKNNIADGGLVKSWVDHFYQVGMYNNGRLKSTLDECKKSGEPTWVAISDDGGAKNNLLSNILKNIHQQPIKSLRNDMHSMGLGIDVYSIENQDYQKNGKITRPMVTNIPSKIIDIFYNNGFAWLGAVEGRDSMHFQYIGSSCFTHNFNKYPNGDGCCIGENGKQGKRFITYNECINKGGEKLSYLGCLGPNGFGTTGWMWIKAAIEPF